jgi:hypothetical protein
VVNRHANAVYRALGGNSPEVCTPVNFGGMKIVGVETQRR